MQERARDPEVQKAYIHGWLMQGPRKLVRNLLELPQPIIAAVNGHAIGLGATLALLSDIIIVSEQAKIGDPHVSMGVVAGDGGAVIWPLLVSLCKAKEMLLTGDLVTAQEALGSVWSIKSWPSIRWFRQLWNWLIGWPRARLSQSGGLKWPLTNGLGTR